MYLISLSASKRKNAFSEMPLLCLGSCLCFIVQIKLGELCPASIKAIMRINIFNAQCLHNIINYSVTFREGKCPHLCQAQLSESLLLLIKDNAASHGHLTHQALSSGWKISTFIGATLTTHLPLQSYYLLLSSDFFCNLCL